MHHDLGSLDVGGLPDVVPWLSSGLCPEDVVALTSYGGTGGPCGTDLQSFVSGLVNCVGVVAGEGDSVLLIPNVVV